MLDDLSSGHREFVPDDVPLDRGLRGRSGGRRRGADAPAGRRRRRPASSTSRRSSTPASPCSGRCTPTSRTSPARRCCSSGCGPRRAREPRLLLQRRLLRHAGRRPRHRADAHPPGVALRGEQAGRRVADARRGPGRPAARTPRCATSTSSAPATTTCYDTSPHNLFPLVLKALTEAPRPEGLRHRLPDAGRHRVRDYVHVAGPRARARRGGRPAGAGRAARAAVQPRQRRRACPCCEVMDAVRRVTGIDFTPELPAPPGRPGPDRRLRRARRARPRLGDAARRRRHGRQRLAGLAAPPGWPRAEG